MDFQPSIGRASIQLGSSSSSVNVWLLIALITVRQHGKSRADEMTIVEHLVEFRKRLIAVVLCYIIVFIVAFVFGGALPSLDG